MKIKMPQRFEVVQGAHRGETDVWIYGIIGDDWSEDGVSAASIAKDLADSNAKTINVRINSPGGNVFDGMAIYNALAQHKAQVIVHIDGSALSAASVIAMAGDEIRMAETALMMIHDPWTLAIGSAEDLREQATFLDKVAGTIVATYAARTGIGADEISDMMAAETWMGAEEALDRGFATSVVEAKRVAAYADPYKYKNAPKRATDAGRKPVAKREEAVMPENSGTAVAQEVRSATFAEIKAECPDADDGFICAQLAANATAELVRTAWAAQVSENMKATSEENAELKAKLADAEARAGKAEEAAAKPPGADPVDARAGMTVGTSSGETFPAAVARLKAAGHAPDVATKMARAEDMGRWEQYIADANK